MTSRWTTRILSASIAACMGLGSLAAMPSQARLRAMARTICAMVVVMMTVVVMIIAMIAVMIPLRPP